MCFSAPGSFILGSALVGSGVYSVRKVKDRKYLPMAMVPFFFGIQQLLEGGVWLALAANNQVMIKLLALGFLFFAIFFWPIWMPFTAYSLEKPGWRKTAIKYLLSLGIVVFSIDYTLQVINMNCLKPVVLQRSISYDTFLCALDGRILLSIYLMYLVIILVSIIVSSVNDFRRFGIMIGFSAALTSVFFFYAFTSVWFFFSALLSFYIIWVIKKIPEQA